MSSKHSGVKSCFEVFIELNTPVQSNFDFDGVETIVFFIFKIMCMHALLVLSLPLTCMHTSLTGGGRTIDPIYGRS